MEYKKCRLCRNETGNLIQIFENSVIQNNTVADVISDILQVDVIKTVRYPSFVCHGCLSKLAEFKLFKEQCKASLEAYDKEFTNREEDIRNLGGSLSDASDNELVLVHFGAQMEGMRTEDHQTILKSYKSQEEIIVPDKIDNMHAIEKTLKKEPFSCENKTELPKETFFEDAPDNGRVSGCIGVQFVNMNAVNHPLVLQSKESRPPEEFILPDMINNIYAIRKTLKEEPASCEKITEDARETSEVAPNDELVLVHIGADCENLKAEDHQFIFKSTVNKFQDELIVPDKINNVHVLETTVKKESFSCEGNETPKITSNEVCKRVLRLRINKHYKLKDWNLKKSVSGNSKETKPEDVTSHEPIFLESVTQQSTLGHSEPQGSKKDKSKSEESDASLGFTCDVCGNKFRRKKKLKNHITTHTLPQECSIHGRSFSYVAKLKKHMRSHADEQLYQCDVCRKNYSNKQILRNHILSHNRPHQCETCKKSFTYLSKLKLHVSKHTGEKPFPCTVCKKRFSLKSTLGYHMRTHTGEKPFPCTVCIKRFSTNQNLVRHMRLHTGEKPYPCTVCKKRFRTNACLFKHMGTHKGDKPFPCTVCEKRFSDKQSLIIHIRTHTGDKPFPCTVCKKHFGEKIYLMKHMLRHTGEKPFPCTVCEKRFTEKKSLVRHMRLHTGEKPFPCTLCKKRFTEKHHFARHMRLHTGDNP